jgi:asparagine synthase (glutamine-hydrolysing)
VKCRLRSRGPVGIELSGGLDSSAIACLAGRLSEGERPEVQTYSGVFDESPEVDERVRIRAVLDRYPQLTPHIIRADDHFRPPYLEPGWNPAGIVGPHEVWLSSLTPLMMSRASTNGCKVVLTGQLGDGLNEGCGLAYFDLLRRRRFRETLEWLGLDWARSKRRCLGRFLFHGILPLVTPGALLRAILRSQDAWRPPTLELPGFLSSELRCRIMERDREIRKARIGRYGAVCPSVRTTLLTIYPPAVGVTLRHPQPVELRHPYLDRRLVEMVLSMAQACRWDIRLREGRFHHRSALNGVLPDSVRVRNFGVEFGPAIRRNASPAVLREWLLEGRSVNIFDRGYVQPSSFLTELEKPVDGRGYLLPLLCVEACLRSLETAGRAQDPCLSPTQPRLTGKRQERRWSGAPDAVSGG